MPPGSSALASGSLLPLGTAGPRDAIDGKGKTDNLGTIRSYKGAFIKS